MHLQQQGGRFLAMNPLKPISATSKEQVPNYPIFIKAVNEDINVLNELIKNYNQSEPQDQIKILKKLYEQYIIINHKYSDRFTRISVGYLAQIHHDFFNSLQEQCNVHNLTVKDLISSNATTALKNIPPSAQTFSDLLVTMHPDKVSALVTLLISGEALRGQEIAALIDQLFQNEPEYPRLNKFFKNHSIEFLGGGNSKNFKIISMHDSSSFILKVENRLGQPKSAEMKVRTDPVFQNLFTPIFAERQSSFNKGTKDKPIFEVRSLVVTEFCSGGDLHSFSGCNAKQDKEIRIRNTVNIVQQMSKALDELGNSSIAFPDMKNSNWLMDEAGTIRLADSKSLIPIKNNLLDKEHVNSGGYRCVSTSYMNTKEWNSFCEGSIKKLSADKLHAAMLGKNLYHVLTGCSTKVIKATNDGASYSYNDPIFSTKEGELFKILINKLVRINPHDRMGIKEVLKQLDLLEQDKKNMFDRNVALLQQMDGVADKSVFSPDCTLMDSSFSLEKLTKINVELNQAARRYPQLDKNINLKTKQSPYSLLQADVT